MFLVERALPGPTAGHLAAAQRALVESCRRLTAQGEPVRYLHSLVVSRRALCLCLFEAATADAVRKANENAQFPFARIEEVVELSAPPAAPLQYDRQQLQARFGARPTALDKSAAQVARSIAIPVVVIALAGVLLLAVAALGGVLLILRRRARHQAPAPSR
jgi:Protein of unknown function (DUF4242)